VSDGTHLQEAVLCKVDEKIGTWSFAEHALNQMANDLPGTPVIHKKLTIGNVFSAKVVDGGLLVELELKHALPGGAVFGPLGRITGFNQNLIYRFEVTGVGAV
jgi:hypothetical protein